MNLFEMFKATIVGTEASVSICIHLYPSVSDVFAVC